MINVSIFQKIYRAQASLTIDVIEIPHRIFFGDTDVRHPAGSTWIFGIWILFARARLVQVGRCFAPLGIFIDDPSAHHVRKIALSAVHDATFAKPEMREAQDGEEDIGQPPSEGCAVHSFQRQLPLSLLRGAYGDGSKAEPTGLRISRKTIHRGGL